MAKLFITLCFLKIFFYKTDAVESRYYPRYHLAPPYGWMNDPNGFCIFQNEYHLFYQYNPNSSLVPGIAHWGHAKSNDFFNWEHLPIAMYPDQDYDKSGVFSGSAVVEDGQMQIFYTGNVNHPDEVPDHEQHQAYATSNDGVKIEKYSGNPVIEGKEYQPNIRDPKVWKHGDTYYMVLGNSFNNDTLGRVLLYTSKDKTSWQQVSILDESDGSLGYMWECPDFFELNGRFILLFSPQGVQPQGDKYKNLYQTGYIVGEFNYETNIFTPLQDFKELDHGHDFYATQTILDDSGRRIVIAWFDMWDQNYPEAADGFTGQMTIPRELSLTKDGQLIQKPVRESNSVRGRMIRSGRASKGTFVPIPDKAGLITIKSMGNETIELFIESEQSVVVSISYDFLKGSVTLDRGGIDGVRKTRWRPRGRFNMEIFVDASSIEVFCGRGEVTFSSRFFPDGPVNVRLGNDTQVDSLNVFAMKRTVPEP